MRPAAALKAWHFVLIALAFVVLVLILAAVGLVATDGGSDTDGGIVVEPY